MGIIFNGFENIQNLSYLAITFALYFYISNNIDWKTQTTYYKISSFPVVSYLGVFLI